MKQLQFGVLLPQPPWGPRKKRAGTNFFGKTSEIRRETCFTMSWEPIRPRFISVLEGTWGAQMELSPLWSPVVTQRRLIPLEDGSNPSCEEQGGLDPSSCPSFSKACWGSVCLVSHHGYLVTGIRVSFLAQCSGPADPHPSLSVCSQRIVTFFFLHVVKYFLKKQISVSEGMGCKNLSRLLLPNLLCQMRKTYCIWLAATWPRLVEAICVEDWFCFAAVPPIAEFWWFSVTFPCSLVLCLSFQTVTKCPQCWFWS